MNAGAGRYPRAMLLPACAVTALLFAAAVTLAGPEPSRRKPPRPATLAAAEAMRPGVVSLDLKDADIRDVLRTFAELEHFNLVIDPEVCGSVTVRLENVRWEDALEVILRSNGLGWVLVGNVVRAAPAARLLARP